MAPQCLPGDELHRGEKPFIMMVNGVGVMGCTDGRGQGRELWIIVSGLDNNHGVVLSGFLRLWSIGSFTFRGLGLKCN